MPFTLRVPFTTIATCKGQFNYNSRINCKGRTRGDPHGAGGRSTEYDIRNKIFCPYAGGVGRNKTVHDNAVKIIINGSVSGMGEINLRVKIDGMAISLKIGVGYGKNSAGKCIIDSVCRIIMEL